jgi:hypothetical protein
MTSQICKRVIVASGACLALVLGVGRMARADETPPAGQPVKTTSELVHSTAKVTGINHAARSVTLKKDDGETVTISVPTDVKAYDHLKVGDKVAIDYYESLAVSILPPGSKPSMSERKERSVDMGGGVTGKETTVSAEIVSIDPTKNTVTFKGPRGQMKTIAVHDPDMQQKVATMKPGQVVQFTYAEATAASIQPMGK